MAGLTDEERRARFDRDCAIINKRADEKIARLKKLDERFDERIQREVDKKITAKQDLRDKRKGRIKAEWDRRLAAVRPGQEYKIPAINEEYQRRSDVVDLEYEDWFNAAAEDQYKKEGRTGERRRQELEILEMRRNEELDRERDQLEHHTQRQRRE